MICNYHHIIAIGNSCLNNFSGALVNSLYRLFNCRVYSCMANHITIGKVQHGKVDTLLIKLFYDGILNGKSAHLRLQVVSRNLW